MPFERLPWTEPGSALPKKYVREGQVSVNLLNSCSFFQKVHLDLGLGGDLKVVELLGDFLAGFPDEKLLRL
jgi:hypothetical protein